MNKNIKFAFALSQANTFENCHFGEAEKYVIYEWSGNDIIWQKELINDTIKEDETQEHGSKKKGLAIIELLQKENVNVLVSRQFGRNIKMVNQHFIPVIIAKETPETALEALKKHIRWIDDELHSSKDGFKLFTIKTGILKTIITKTDK